MTEHTIHPEDTEFNQGQPKSDNADPITGEPGAHPVGVGLGAAGGGVAGAAIGAAAGPVGAAVGAVAGAVIGGMAGKDIAESFDPTAEDAYWREHYRERPYVTTEDPYERFQPAYRYGWEARMQHEGRDFEEIEPQLQERWMTAKPEMGWDSAGKAARDAWEHFAARHAPSEPMPGESQAPMPDVTPEYRGQAHPAAPNTAPVERERRAMESETPRVERSPKALEPRDL